MVNNLFMSSTCIFCQIAQAELPANIVYQDEHTIAFLDHFPVFKGHLLVIPKQHLGVLTDLSGEQMGPFFRVVQKMTKAVEQALGANGSFVAMNNKVSQSVPHFHVHVIPRKKKDGLRGFFWPRVKYESEEEKEEIREQISSFCSESGS